MTKKEISRSEFQAWLRAQGAYVIATTSPYEFARFRAHGALHIIYRRQTGAFSAEEFGMQCLSTFQRGGNLGMGFTAPRRNLGQAIRATLIERDGNSCFFCGEPMDQADTTIEHLVAKARGGPDHPDNMVLAHERCNQAIGAMPLIDKIRVHVQMQIKKAIPA